MQQRLELQKRLDAGPTALPCLACSYNYTGSVGAAYPDEQRQLALKLYLEGMGLRAIGRVLGVSSVTILRWVRAYGERAARQAAEAPPRPCASPKWRVAQLRAA